MALVWRGSSMGWYWLAQLHNNGDGDGGWRVAGRQQESTRSFCGRPLEFFHAGWHDRQAGLLALQDGLAGQRLRDTVPERRPSTHGPPHRFPISPPAHAYSVPYCVCCVRDLRHHAQAEWPTADGPM